MLGEFHQVKRLMTVKKEFITQPDSVANEVKLPSVEGHSMLFIRPTDTHG